MNEERIIKHILFGAGKDIKEIFGNEVEINIEEEKEHLSQTTDKIPDIKFKLGVILKRK